MRPSLTLGPALWVIALWLGVSGCSLTKMAADTTAGFMTEAAPAGRAYFDYQSAGTAAAAGLMQLEGLHKISPDNEQLALTLAQAYVVYAFGWVQDEREEAMFATDYVLTDYHQQRAYNMYKRAYDLVFRVVCERDEKIEKLVKGDPDLLAKHLRQEWTDPEDDTELTFWWALTWGSVVTNSPDFDALIDFNAVKAVAAHVVFLDETYENAGALAMLGGYESSYPEALGGNWKKGRELFERAIALSKRRNHLHLINFARTYALNAQDKELFVSLLNEVINAPDLGDDVRLSNKVARRRAIRYLKNIDQWFP
jgi:hypothetical protein